MTDDGFKPRSLSDWYETKRNVVIKGTHGDKREQVAKEIDDRRIKELIERHKETLDRLAGDD